MVAYLPPLVGEELDTLLSALAALSFEGTKGVGKTAAAQSWLASSVGDDLLDAVVVTTGSEAYRHADGIAVVPAALLGP